MRRLFRLLTPEIHSSVRIKRRTQVDPIVEISVRAQSPLQPLRQGPLRCKPSADVLQRSPRHVNRRPFGVYVAGDA